MRTCAIPERLRGVLTTRRYTNPHLPYLPYDSGCVVVSDDNDDDDDDDDDDDAGCVHSAQLLLKQTRHLSISQLQQMDVNQLSQLCPQLPLKFIQVYFSTSFNCNLSCSQEISDLTLSQASGTD